MAELPWRQRKLNSCLLPPSLRPAAAGLLSVEEQWLLTSHILRLPDSHPSADLSTGERRGGQQGSLILNSPVRPRESLLETDSRLLWSEGGGATAECCCGGCVRTSNQTGVEGGEVIHQLMS